MKKILYTPSEFDEELYDYGCIVLKQYILYFFISSLISIFLGCMIEFIYFNIVFIPLRRTLGGFHFHNKKACLVGSILLGVTASYGSIYAPHIPFTTIFILLIVFIILSIYNGCIEHPNKPLSSNEKQYYLKKGIRVEVTLLIVALLLSTKGYHSLIFINIFSIGFCSLGNYLINNVT